MTDNPSTVTVVLTQGDPGGIGPEIVVRAVSRMEDWERLSAKPLIVGDQALLHSVADHLSLYWPSDVKILQPDQYPSGLPIRLGQIQAVHGQAALACLEAAHHLVSGSPDDLALVTAPISKEAIHLAGSSYPGHTEMLADWCGLDPEKDVRMLLAIPRLKVLLHTIHIPLSLVPQSVTRDSLARTFELTARWCLHHLGSRTRVGVCGLNPHAGENGHIGREELDTIRPALEQAKQEFPEIDWSGPHPGDTIFGRALAGDLDLIIAMYHDQGLIPVKTLDMHHGVNMTIGLPYVRTSPDHGTAFDLAGRGIADPRSLWSAIEMAVQLVRARRTGPVGR